MIYLDTSFIISYVDEADQNHVEAVRLMDRVEGEHRVVSKLVTVELASVYSRAGLERPLELALYSLKLVKAEEMPLDFNLLLRESFRAAPLLKLRTLDLLHVVASSLMGARGFLTFDRDIISKAKEVERIGVKVLS